MNNPKREYIFGEGELFVVNKHLIHIKQPSDYHNFVFLSFFLRCVYEHQQKYLLLFHFFSSHIHPIFWFICNSLSMCPNNRQNKIFKSRVRLSDGEMIMRIINSMWKLVWKTLVCPIIRKQRTTKQKRKKTNHIRRPHTKIVKKNKKKQKTKHIKNNKVAPVKEISVLLKVE